MKERPILFSGAMVRAILSGAKSQTRRLVTGTPRAMQLLADCKHPPEIEDIPDRTWIDTKHGTRARWQIRHAHESPDGIGDGMNAWCPYGHRWTRLWVRETWAGADRMSGNDCDRDPPQVIAYRADESARIFDGDLRPHRASATNTWNFDKLTWRPSIHMPRWASRLTLEVTGVRVERLQDISEADARAEGVKPLQMDMGSCLPSYEGLWDSLNKRAPWSSDPWVWVLSFRVVAAEEKAVG